jgi:hypothetical protein
LKQTAPEVQVEGADYPPTDNKKFMAQVCSTVFMGFVAFMFFGEKVFQMLGRPAPQMYKDMQENKWMWLIGGFILSSNIQANLM